MTHINLILFNEIDLNERTFDTIVLLSPCYSFGNEKNIYAIDLHQQEGFIDENLYRIMVSAISSD
jgi:hypothetical protein